MPNHTARQYALRQTQKSPLAPLIVIATAMLIMISRMSYADWTNLPFSVSRPSVGYVSNGVPIVEDANGNIVVAVWSKNSNTTGAFSVVVAKWNGISWVYEDVFIDSHGGLAFHHTSLDLTLDPDGNMWLACSFGENRLGGNGCDTFLLVFRQSPNSTIWTQVASAETPWPKFRAITLTGDPLVIDRVIWTHNPSGSTLNSKRPILIRETYVNDAAQVNENDLRQISFFTNPIGDLNSTGTVFRRHEWQLNSNGSRSWKRVIPTPVVIEQPQINGSVRGLISTAPNARFHISLYTAFTPPLKLFQYFKSALGTTGVPTLDSSPSITTIDSPELRHAVVIQANQQPFLAWSDGAGDIEKQLYDGAVWGSPTNIPSTSGLFPRTAAVISSSGLVRVGLIGANSSAYHSTNGVLTTIVSPGAPFSLAYPRLVPNGDADSISFGLADGTSSIRVYKQP